MNKEIRQYLREVYPLMNMTEIAEEVGINLNEIYSKKPMGFKKAVRLAKATGQPIMDFWHK